MYLEFNIKEQYIYTINKKLNVLYQEKKLTMITI